MQVEEDQEQEEQEIEKEKEEEREEEKEERDIYTYILPWCKNEILNGRERKKKEEEPYIALIKNNCENFLI